MSEDSEKIDIHRGLKGVYFDRSQVCFIDGRAGELLYRGYSIHDLAERSTFEETCHLLMFGELPSADQLAQFDAALKAARTLPPAIYDVIRAVRDAQYRGRHPGAHREPDSAAVSGGPPGRQPTRPNCARPSHCFR